MAGRMRRSSEEPAVPTGVLNTVSVLKCFTTSAPLLSVTQIAERIDLHKSSVSRILAALAVERFVEKESMSGRYRLGPGLIALTAQMLSSFNVIDVARPILRQLADTTGDTANLTILNNDEVQILDHAIGASPIRVISPGTVPAYCNSTGRALLAFGGAALVDRVLARGTPALTPATVTSPRRLRAILEEIRATGCNVIVGEYMAELGGVSSPVFDSSELCIAALSISVPAFTLTAERASELVPLVKQSAHAISASMGSRTALRVLQTAPPPSD